MVKLSKEEVMDLVNKYERVYDPKGRWYNTKGNLWSFVRAQVRPSKSIICKDETVREGLSMFTATNLTEDDKMKVVEALVDAGVKEMEVGTVGYNPAHFEFAKRIKREKLPIRLGSHAIAAADPKKDPRQKDQLDKVVDSGTDIMNFLTMSGLYYAQMPRGGDADALFEEAINTTVASIEYSVDRGIFVSWGITNIGAMRRDWAERLIRAAVDAGMKRCYIYDVDGSYTPELMKFLVLWVRDLVGPSIEIAVHTHDDLGMATANSVAAVCTGEANVVDTLVNAIGDRAGNTAFDEFVLAVESLYGVKTGIKTEKLLGLSQLVEKISGLPVQYNKALVGRYTFKLMGHAMNVLNLRTGDILPEYPISPETVGQVWEILYGKANVAERGTATSTAYLHAQSLGYKPTDEQLQKINEGILKIIQKKGVATEAEGAAVIRNVMGKKQTKE